MDIIHGNGDVVAGRIRAENDTGTDQEALFISFHDGTGISTQLQTHTGEIDHQIIDAEAGHGGEALFQDQLKFYYQIIRLLVLVKSMKTIK